jgi:hypothetical protein
MGTVLAIVKEFLAMPLVEIEALPESSVHEARAGACSVMGKGRHPQEGHGRAAREARRAVSAAARPHRRLGPHWTSSRTRCSGRGSSSGPETCCTNSPARTPGRSGTPRSSPPAAFLGRGQVHDTLAISRLLVDDDHPLVQKGAGWMLSSPSPKAGRSTRRPTTTTGPVCPGPPASACTRPAHGRHAAAERERPPAGRHGTARPQPDAHDDGHLQPRHAGPGPRGGGPDGRPAADK